MDFGNLGAWAPLLADQFQQPYFKELEKKLDKAYGEGVVYPPADQVFRAFSLTQPQDVRVVILGQDPYHGEGQANGLAFSVGENVALPPSLRNIFREISEDLGKGCPSTGDLTFWAEQGVLMLNPVLTVAQGQAASHVDFGWQTFTDVVFSGISQFSQPIAYLLWGKQAQKKGGIARNSAYPRLVLESVHPSPLSAYRGFFGSKPFSKINEFLAEQGEKEIDWVGGGE